MNKAEAVYEFINQYAYFACSGIIVMENYTVSRGKINDLIDTFDIFMEEHQGLMDLVAKGEISEEAADSILRASINKLRSGSIVKFFELVNEKIFPNTDDNTKREAIVSGIMKKIKSKRVSGKDFIELIEALRQEEENIIKEADT